MIENPVDFLRKSTQKHYPLLEVTASNVLGAGAYVDARFKADAGKDFWHQRNVRLVLTHDAPADSRPLLERYALGRTIKWEYTVDYVDQIPMGEKHRVHPWQFQNALLAVYVCTTQRRRDKVIRVSTLQDHTLNPATGALAMMHVARQWGMEVRELTPEERRALAKLNPSSK